LQEGKLPVTKRVLLAAVAAAALAGLGMVSPALAQIKIASAGPMTGEYATFGTQLKNGAEMAVADINAKGGVLGKKLELEIGDDACDPKQAVSIANKFADDGVVFVAGHFCSSSSIPASKVYTENNILQITPASTNPKFTDEGSWNTFRTCGRDDQQGEMDGNWLAKNMKDVKIAVLDDNTTYGKGIADETKKNLNKSGKQEDMYQAYVPGEADYTALVSRMKQAGIGAVFIGGYHKEIGTIIKQAREQGLNARFFGPDSLQTKEFWQVAGPAAEGAYMSFPAEPRNRPEAKAVVAEFKAKGIDPEGYTLYTYAAIQEWAAAAEKAGSTDPKKVAEVLRAGTWPTVLGDISYDKKGDITRNEYVWYIWHDGDYKEVEMN
jgi:branched-chain amino acid transport system substrate-binding protein